MQVNLLAPSNTFRDHQHGTWFVQSLVEVFMTHAHDTELVCLPRLTVCLLRFILQNIQVDLLRMTSERLSHFTNEQGEKQTCNVEMRSDQDVSAFYLLFANHFYKTKMSLFFFTSYLPSTCTRQRRPCFFTSCLPSTCTRQRGLCFLSLVCQALVQGQDVFFYLLPPRHLYKRIYFNPGLGGGPHGADLITREQSMEQ